MRAFVIGALSAALALSACAAQTAENITTSAVNEDLLSGDLISGEWYFGEEDIGARYLRGVGFAVNGVTIVSFRCEPATRQIDVFHDVGPVTTTSSTLRIIVSTGAIDVAMRPHETRGWVGSLQGDDPRLDILAASEGRFVIEHNGVVQRLPWDGPLNGILVGCDS